jgi:Domain of unknown function (DUF4190)
MSSLILGFLSCVIFGIITSIPAIILGYISLSKYKKNPCYKGRKIAIAGIVLGCLGIAITICIFVTFLRAYYEYR